MEVVEKTFLTREGAKTVQEASIPNANTFGKAADSNRCIWDTQDIHYTEVHTGHTGYTRHDRVHV